VVRLVNNKLRPIKKPITEKTFLGPYRSIAQPASKAAIALKTIRTDMMAEVDARVRLKASSRLLKKTPKEEFTPIIMKPLAMIAATMIQP